MTSGLVRRRLIGLVVLVIVTAVGMSLLFTGTTVAATTFDGGNGTVENPYEISNWTQLAAVNDDLTAHYVLVNNLTQNTDGYAEFASTTANGGAGWAPIGEPFTGTFDGKGHTIDGLYIDRASTGDIGLFGIIGTGGEVRNLGVTNVNLTGANRIGGLAGENRGLIENSFTTGVVDGSSRTGGLVGISKGTITNTYSGAEVISDGAEIGGLVGKNAGTIEKSYSFGVVDSAGTGSKVGGLIGLEEGTTADSFWDTETSGQSTSDGGTGKTTSEMHDVATFTDTATTGLSNPWDFHDDPNDDTGTIDIWNIAGSINDGYPYLTVPDLQGAETGDANGDGTVDTITATFTKSVADSSVSAGDFTLSKGTVDSVSTGTTTDDDTVVLTVSGLPTGDTSVTPDVTLLADSVTDLSGNVGPSTDTTVTANDGASPVMLSAVTGDADEDGHLDRVTVTYSEGVTQTSTAVGDYNIGGATYEGESIVTDDDGDATLVFSVTELGTFDTDSTPEVAYAQGSTADAGGNLMASQTITDTTDGAAPVLISTSPTDNATGVNTGTNLDATFSESVVAGSGTVEIRQSADDTVFETIGITDPGKVSISGNTVTINPDGTLSGNTGYYVLIDDTAINDSSTNSFGGISGTTTWNFETADTTAPSVTVDQPNGGERLAGGSTFDILWTATDADGIATDGIDLSYTTDSGTTWTTIATGEANDGTYNWTVPSIDSETVMVRVSATDTSGNVGRDESDSVFTIDSTPPDLLAAETDDANGDGTVDEVTATFTESVADSSVGAGDFTLSTGTVDSVSTGATTDDDTIVLTVSGLPSGDTSATPDVTLLADSVTDIAGDTGPSTDTTVTASDGASPVMLSTVTGDEDGDGHLDRVTVTYSEGVTPASTDVGDYDIGGVTYEGESIATDDDGDDTLVFSITELGSFDTGTTPDVAYAQGTTADAGGNLMASQTITTTDGAAPVLVSTSPVDGATGVGNDTNLVATLSESVVAGSGNVEILQSADDTVFETIGITEPGKVSISGDTVTINPDGTLSGNTGYYVLIDDTAIDDSSTNSFGGISGTTTWNFETADTTAPSVTVDQPNGGERLAGGSQYDIQWTATDADGIATDGIDFSYTTDSGTTWTSIATGEANDGTYTWTVPSIDSTTVLVRVEATDANGNTGQDVSDSRFEIDSTAPNLQGATTGDANGDGTVDTITATFTESVADSSVSAGDFTLSTGTVDSVSTGTTTDDTVVLTVSGLPTGDTSATPEVTLLADSVTDLAGSTGPSTDTTVTASDGASPVMLSAVTGDADGDGHLDRVTVTYSEGVTQASTDVGDYDIGGVTYEGESIVTDDDGDDTLVFSITELGSFDTGATPDLAYAQGTTADAAGNLALSQTVTATDGAAPIANSLTLGTTPISDSETGDGNEVTVTVKFGEDMGQTPGDVTVTPDVNGDLSTAPTVENKRWTDAQTFKADIQFTDDDEVVSGISLEVSGAKDIAGNAMSSAVSTSYDVDTTNPSTGGGGSGISTEYFIKEQDTESTSDGDSIEVIISGYEIGDTVSVPTENVETDSFAVEVVSVSFDMGTNVPNTMIIQAGTEPPADVPEYGDAEQTDYVSVDIEGNLADRVTDGLITVRVSADRMPSDPSAVSIYSYKGDSWDKTNTKYLGDRRYEIYTSSFPTFVMVVEDMTEPTTPQSTTPTTTVTETPPTTPQSTTPTRTVTEPQPTTETSTHTSTRTETPGFGIAISLFALVGAGLLVIHRRRE